MISNTISAAGSTLPDILLPIVDGESRMIGATQNEESWKKIVLYRGMHGPLCKPYQAGLEELKSQF